MKKLYIAIMLILVSQLIEIKSSAKCFIGEDARIVRSTCTNNTDSGSKKVESIVQPWKCNGKNPSDKEDCKETSEPISLKTIYHVLESCIASPTDTTDTFTFNTSKATRIKCEQP